VSEVGADQVLPVSRDFNIGRNAVSNRVEMLFPNPVQVPVTLRETPLHLGIQGSNVLLGDSEDPGHQ
jgi:hypothetical protein